MEGTDVLNMLNLLLTSQLSPFSHFFNIMIIIHPSPLNPDSTWSLVVVNKGMGVEGQLLIVSIPPELIQGIRSEGYSFCSQQLRRHLPSSPHLTQSGVLCFAPSLPSLAVATEAAELWQPKAP
jgi:hypothetical protein